MFSKKLLDSFQEYTIKKHCGKFQAILSNNSRDK